MMKPYIWLLWWVIKRVKSYAITFFQGHEEKQQIQHWSIEPCMAVVLMFDRLDGCKTTCQKILVVVYYIIVILVLCIITYFMFDFF